MAITRIAALSPEEFAECGAALLTQWIAEAIEREGECLLALSGGSTPGPVYEQLAQCDIAWPRVWVCLADDRCVPADDDRSNQHLLRERLLQHASIPAAQLLLPSTEQPPDACAEEYGRRIETVTANRPIDVAILGMGDDGHIASLFPPLPDEAFGPKTAIHTITDRFDVHDRISMTLPVLSQAQRVLLLIRGAAKLRTFDEMSHQTHNPRMYPLHEILSRGQTTVLTLV
jgi:6-phosphogluconolactonase